MMALQACFEEEEEAMMALQTCSEEEEAMMALQTCFEEEEEEEEEGYDGVTSMFRRRRTYDGLTNMFRRRRRTYDWPYKHVSKKKKKL